jgi:chemotaxis protein histidine kinase CheA
MSDSDDIVKEFLVESYENLDRLDRELIELEKHPSDREILASVFRTIHTIKGTSGFLSFGKLEAVTHVGENLLARLRDGQLTLNPEIATALLALVDAVRKMLSRIEAQGNEGENDHSQLIAGLTRLLQPISEEKAATTPAKRAARKTADPQPDNLQPEKKTTPPAAEEGAAPPAGKAEAAAAGGAGSVPEAQAPETATAAEAKSGAATGHSASDSTIRVDVSLLDQLMNLVGELVLARNQILQFTNTTEESGLVATSQRLNLITSELQESVMKTRMQPIGNIWSKFPRTVRDVALGCGKQVRIEMSGKETELDKTLIEAIKDPLTHLVRNAVDHGIEPPEVRQAAGKNPEGLLFLHAFHEGGQVNIEISDDGAGLDLERVRNKAIQKGLITPEQASRMSEREITNLVFLPGLSTAEKVTNVSGRGVGMDVVKTHIEKIGGTVDIQSKTGQGVMVRMKIPLTLAIIPALIVTSADERYAIPQVSLLELVRLEQGVDSKGIEMIHGAPVYRLRGRLLPLVYLDRELKTGREHSQVASAAETRSGVLDFAKARLAHLQWIDRLRHVLDDSATLTLEQAGSPTQCALGKWLYETALKDHRGIKEMTALEEAHKRFHGTVREVVSHKARGDAAAAENSLVTLRPMSQMVIDLLSTVERKVEAARNVNIVVLMAEGQQFGLVVDEVNDTEEIVVKPLAKQLKQISVYAGATIMGDGKVALILDVMGLAHCSSILSEGREHALAETAAGEAGHSDQRQKLVLFTGRGGARMAVPLSMLARLENIDFAQVERSGNQWVTQYRGQILPLIRVSHALEERRKLPSADDALALPTRVTLQVLVLEHERRSFGLVVNQILDIVESTLEPKSPPTRAGVQFASVIDERVTELLDVPAILQAGEAHAPAEAAAAGS